MASKLTNKFTKSVLEREQKEQKYIEPTAPASEPVQAPVSVVKEIVQEPAQVQPIAVPVVAAVEEVAAAPIAAKQPAAPATPKPGKKPSAPAVMNLDAFLNPSENRQAKNKTFYLDTAVIDAIKQAAVANHMAESKLVNDILKKVLGV